MRRWHHPSDMFSAWHVLVSFLPSPGPSVYLLPRFNACSRAKWTSADREAVLFGVRASGFKKCSRQTRIDGRVFRLEFEFDDTDARQIICADRPRKIAVRARSQGKNDKRLAPRPGCFQSLCIVTRFCRLGLSGKTNARCSKTLSMSRRVNP